MHEYIFNGVIEGYRRNAFGCIYQFCEAGEKGRLVIVVLEGIIRTCNVLRFPGIYISCAQRSIYGWLEEKLGISDDMIDGSCKYIIYF